MKKQTSPSTTLRINEWEKEFGKMFSGVYMRTDPGAHTIDEQIKSFISDLLAKEKMELVERIRDFVDERNCWILKDGDRFISEGELVTFLDSLSPHPKKVEVG